MEPAETKESVLGKRKEHPRMLRSKARPSRRASRVWMAVRRSKQSSLSPRASGQLSGAFVRQSHAIHVQRPDAETVHRVPAGATRLGRQGAKYAAVVCWHRLNLGAGSLSKDNVLGVALLAHYYGIDALLLDCDAFCIKTNRPDLG
jgi:hypothetical protein